MSRRASFGGLALRDSNRTNIRSGSRSPSQGASKRRVSFGGGAYTSNDLSFDGNNSINSSSSNALSLDSRKDRRTMLEEWRAKVRAKEANGASAMQQQYQQPDKENCNQMESLNNSISSLPPPPPVSSEGTTAVERFRLRRLQRERRALGEENYSNPTPPLPPSIPASDASVETYSTNTSVICFDDEPISVSAGSKIGGRATSTSAVNRRMTISSGARRRVAKGRKSFLPTSFDAEADAPSAPAPEATTQAELTLNHDIGGEMNEPGLRSKLIQMEKRIHQLEEEKMSIAMSKAPLEARLRQKEDQWSKEQTKYDQEISSLMNASKETTDKMKELEMEMEALQEENRKLKFEERKRRQEYIDATEKSESNDVWSRQLQNDRDVVEYKEKLHAAEEEIKALRLEKVSIQSEVNATNMELSALIREFDDLQEEYEILVSKKDSNADAEIQLEELKKEHTATTAQLNATSGELASLKTQSKFDMEMKEKEWQEERDKLMFDMSVMKSRAGSLLDDNSADPDVEDEAVLRARIEERDRRIAQLEEEVLKGEQIRRDMHNRIQELRGNIRVFVRTRPFLPGDNEDTISSIDVLPDGESLSIEGHAKTHDFKFDKVFAPSSGQESVFSEVSEFVQSALDGYHVCLFSYGQTGSGKTHTMQGSGNGAMRGIIPRAVEQILNQAQRMKEQKWTFTVTASFLEIYNEDLRDLLVTMNGNGNKNSKTDQEKLAIKRDKSGKSYVSNLTKIDIKTENLEEGMQGLKAVMSSAARTRSVACTKMNSVSSRSHSVFMLQLSGINEENGTIVEGALNLCDLAGSERLDRSGAGNNAQRLKETQSINKSLSCLGDVFTALSNGSSHVPYRNSKLTYLLQDCLSGDGKALMFVNLSPTLASSNESLCSLRFAQRVNQVELGKATKHVQYRSR